MRGTIRRLVPAFVRRRYTLKFAIVLIVLAASVGAVGLMATAQIEQEVQQNADDEYATLAEQEAAALSEWFENNERTIQTFRQTAGIEEMSTVELDRIVRGAEAESLHIVDLEDRTILSSSEQGMSGESVEETELENPTEVFAELGTHTAYSTDIYELEDEDGNPYPAITYVLATDGQADRAFVYTVDVTPYAEQIHSFPEDSSTTTLVLDANDNIIIDDAGYGESNEMLFRPYGESDVAATARADGPGGQQIDAQPRDTLAEELYGFADEEYVVGYATVEGTDKVVLVHQPISEAYGFAQDVSQYGLLATLAGVFLIGTVGIVLGQNTSRSIDRLTTQAGRMEEGDLDVDLSTTRIDNIGRLYDALASMRDALKEQIAEAQHAREEAEHAQREAEELNQHLELKAEEHSHVMQVVKEGDLTRRMNAESQNEAMIEIAEEFNEMVAEIEVTIEELNGFATDVATASEQVTASSEEVRSASEQVSESMQEISHGAERQNQSLQSASNEMTGLSTTTEEIAASSNEVADIAELTAETGQAGQDAAQDAIHGMEEIETESAQTVEEMRRLEAEVDQVDQLIDQITEIAEQTNMLALNANIEASRSAAEGGSEGFGVVAKEVKELSSDAKDAAEEIEERLEAISEQTERSAEEAERTSAEIATASEQVENAVEALEEIATYAQQTNTGVQDISAASEQQAAATQEVVSIVDQAATVSEETTAEAENVAAAAEEQTTSLSEVSESASSLSQRASQLSSALSRFETDPHGVSAGGSDPSAEAETGGASAEDDDAWANSDSQDDPIAMSFADEEDDEDDPIAMGFTEETVDEGTVEEDEDDTEDEDGSEDESKGSFDQPFVFDSGSEE